MTQPDQCKESGCPLAGKSKGFALPSGDPHKSRIALLLETPATEEISYDISELSDGSDELARRRLYYPGLRDSYLTRGAPVVGRSGYELFSWALAAVGLSRTEVYLCNVLQCYPGKGEGGTIAYPTGKGRVLAESRCSNLWWRLDQEFHPDFSIINYHPAAIIRDVTPLPIQINVFIKAKRLSKEGKVVVCCGGKAAKTWLGYGENVTKWAGHWQRETDLTRKLRSERLA